MMLCIYSTVYMYTHDMIYLLTVHAIRLCYKAAYELRYLSEKITFVPDIMS